MQKGHRRGCKVGVIFVVKDCFCAGQVEVGLREIVVTETDLFMGLSGPGSN